MGIVQKTVRLVVALAALLVGVCAAAQTTSYADRRADFVADTGATSIGPLKPYGALFPATVGLITFVNGPDAHGGFGDSSNELPGTDISIGNWENFTLLIAGGAYAIGYSEHEPAYLGPPSPVTGCNSPCTDSTFSIELFAGSTSLGSFRYNAPDDVSDLPGGPVGFFGVRSAIPFDRVEVREVIGSIDNEYFADFLLSPVPEPSTALLWALGGLVVVAVRRRKPEQRR